MVALTLFFFFFFFDFSRRARASRRVDRSQTVVPKREEQIFFSQRANGNTGFVESARFLTGRGSESEINL